MDTVEWLKPIIAGSSPAAILAMIALGVIAAIMIINRIDKTCNEKIAGLPEGIKELTEAIGDLKVQNVELKSRLWSQDEIDNAVRSKTNDAISDHVDRWHLSKTQLIGGKKS